MLFRSKSLGLKQRLRMRRLKLKHRTALLKLFRKRKQIISDPSKRKSQQALKRLSEHSRKLMSLSDKLELLRIRLKTRQKYRKISTKPSQSEVNYTTKSKLQNNIKNFLLHMMYVPLVTKVSHTNTKRQSSANLTEKLRTKILKLLNSKPFLGLSMRDYRTLIWSWTKLQRRTLNFQQRTLLSPLLTNRYLPSKERLKLIKRTRRILMKKNVS